MSDDPRRPNDTVADASDDDERRRARLNAARSRGGLCAGCGRALADGEPVWWASSLLSGAYGRLSRRWGPVGKECAPPDVVRETEGTAPERCVGCGRGVYYQLVHRRRRWATCSNRCADLSQAARRKEARGS